jgi:hypothetical protein
MRMLNQAFEGADAFTKMLQKVGQPATAVDAQVSRDVAEWNAAVERKKAEKQRLRHVKAMK